MDGESMDSQIDATLPRLEEWKGKETQVFHMQSSLSFMFDLYKLKNIFWAVMGPCLQIPESRIQSTSSLCLDTRVGQQEVGVLVLPGLQKIRLPLYAEPWALEDTALL